MAEVDLNRLAAAYGHRSHDPIRQRIEPILAAVPVGPGDLIVDVGGGRGRHAAALSSASGATALVVDPAMGMVVAARGSGSLAAVGRGEKLPLGAGCADLVLFHLSIHHGDWRVMLAEAWRVVRPGGAVWVWTMPPEHLRTSYLTQWFPRVGEIDAARFPAIGDLEAEFAVLGGVPRLASDRSDVQRPAGDWRQAVEAGFVSTLHLLTPGEIAEGIDRFTAAHPDPTEMIGYTLAFTGVWSIRPPVEF
jgi:SAM-dependent methyltransferase